MLNLNLQIKKYPVLRYFLCLPFYFKEMEDEFLEERINKAALMAAIPSNNFRNIVGIEYGSKTKTETEEYNV